MKSIIRSLSIGFLLFSTLSFSQTIDWAYKIGGSYEDRAHDVVKDSLGNIYITGGFSNTVNFNTHGTDYQINAVSENSSDVYVAKYNKDFELLWAFALGSSAWEMGAKLLVDDSLNIYVIGDCAGNIDFDPSNATFLFDCSPSNAFIAKFDKNGNLKAVNKIPKISMYPANADIYRDNQNSIFTYSNDTLSKFDSDLQLLWRKRISGKPELFHESEFYVIQNFKTPFNSSTYDQHDLILEKYDNSSGELSFSKQYAFANGYICGGFIKKTKNNKLIISGSFWGDMSFYGKNDTISVSNADMAANPWGQYPQFREFIAMFDTAHNLLWAKAYDDSSPKPYIIETDDIGSIYTLGFLNFDSNFDPENPVILTNGGWGNYVAKYDSNFRYCAASQFLGGSYNDFIGGFKLYNDTAVMCGHFFNSIDLDLGNSSFLLASNAPEDIFVARYSNFNIETNLASVPENIESLPKISVFPNPSNCIFGVQINSTSEKSLIRVYDLKGNFLFSKLINENFVSIDLSSYPSSLYILSIKIGNSIFSKRIFKN